MNNWLRVAAAALIALSLATTVSAAESNAVKMEARILAKLNHFASDADKNALQAIVKTNGSTAQEKTVAQALMNVQHTVADADKPKLQAIVDDKDSPESLKTIASIMLKLNHTASDEDKAKLTKIAE